MAMKLGSITVRIDIPSFPPRHYRWSRQWWPRGEMGYGSTLYMGTYLPIHCVKERPFPPVDLEAEWLKTLMAPPNPTPASVFDDLERLQVRDAEREVAPVHLEDSEIALAFLQRMGEPPPRVKDGPYMTATFSRDENGEFVIEWGGIE